MKQISRICLAFLLLPATTFAGTEFTLGLSDESLMFKATRKGDQGQSAWVQAQFSDSEEKLRHIEVGLNVTDQLSNSVSGGFGVTTIAQTFEIGSTDIEGIALAVQLVAEAELPLKVPLNLTASFDYAPSIASFQDIDSYSAFRIALKYPLLNNGDIGIGYHKMKSELDSNNLRVTADQATTLQLTFNF